MTYLQHNTGHDGICTTGYRVVVGLKKPDGNLTVIVLGDGAVFLRTWRALLVSVEVHF